MFVIKRRPVLAVLSVIIFNFTPIIFALSLLPYHVEYLSALQEEWFQSELTIVFDLCVYLTLARVWLVFYDYKHSAQLLAFQWEKHILQNRVCKPWALRFKLLGNSKIIHSMAIFCWISIEGVSLLSVH